MENEEKNMIKILSYVSKINNEKKKMTKLFSQLMKNINFSYEENKNNIKYNEYYFNGIFAPKNIEFKDISNASLNISWNINDINNINIDKNKIKYIVEMRKENEKFEKVYEGKNNICSVNNLNNNTNYEFKICSLYNDLIGECTDIQKIKTKDIIQKSNLLDNSPEFLQFKFKPGDNYTLNDNGLIFRNTLQLSSLLLLLLLVSLLFELWVLFMVDKEDNLIKLLLLLLNLKLLLLLLISISLLFSFNLDGNNLILNLFFNN